MVRGGLRRNTPTGSSGSVCLTGQKKPGAVPVVPTYLSTRYDHLQGYKEGGAQIRAVERDYTKKDILMTYI